MLTATTAMTTRTLISSFPLSPCPALFFNVTATTEIYTLSLHDALPISRRRAPARRPSRGLPARRGQPPPSEDRKSTRLNSSHLVISYAVFCLKKKKKLSWNHLLTEIPHYRWYKQSDNKDSNTIAKLISN